tara:strand:+ start:523 stop:864 length:342 start_codon:yes stop_codon:yes gene_type:complete
MIKFKDILKEHSLGKLPSDNLIKMKWNPITEARPVFPGQDNKEHMDHNVNEESYPMDKNFAEDFEKSCVAFANHIKNEIKDGHKESNTMKKMLKNIMLVKGYPKLMARMVGQE